MRRRGSERETKVEKTKWGGGKKKKKNKQRGVWDGSVGVISHEDGHEMMVPIHFCVSQLFYHVFSLSD